MAERPKASFTTEADLCAAFVKALPPGWKAYQEWAGWDILLVREADGAQIGIEAKLTLNAKVIDQAAEGYSVESAGPDYRAVLVPYGVAGTLISVCGLIGLTVIAMKSGGMMDDFRFRHSKPFAPELPEISDWERYWSQTWFDRCPHQRHELPDYVPDVEAGKAAPTQLTAWKIKAIKIAVTLERRGFVVRPDFKHFQIDISRWTQPGWRWLAPGPIRGTWVVSPRMPDFKAQHPLNYEQIAADYEKWKAPEPAIQLPLEEIEKEKS